MICYYYIKLPDGGNIRIPASSGISSLDEELNTKIKEYKASSDINNSEELINYLMQDLKVEMPVEDLKEILVDSNEDNLINNINDYLASNGSLGNLSTILLRKITQGQTTFEYIPPKKRKGVITGKEKTDLITLTELLQKLQEPIGQDYLDKIDSIGLINNISPEQKILELNNKLEELKNSGINSKVDNSLYNLLTSVFKSSNKKQGLLYSLNFSGKSSDSILINTEESAEPIIFYNESNSLSLALGIFKYLGKDLNEEVLQDILEEFNISEKITPKDFFLGKFIKNEYVPEVLSNYLKDPKINQTLINRLIEAVFINNQNFYGWTNAQTQELINDTKELIKYIDLTKYSKDPFSEEKELRILYKKESDENSATLINSISKRLKNKSVKERRDYFYSPKEIKQFSYQENTEHQLSAYNFIRSNISFKNDLIKFPSIGEYGIYVVPLSIKLDKRGLRMTGLGEFNGEFKLFYEYFNDDNIKLEYRKLETTQNPSQLDNAAVLPKEDTISIISSKNTFIDPKIVKNNISRGSTIISKKGKREYTNIVKAVYPGGIEVNSKARFLVPFTNISKIIVPKSQHFIDKEFTDNDRNKFSALKNYSEITRKTSPHFHIETGDIIVYSDEQSDRINRVINTSEISVYILVKDKEGNHFVQELLKENVRSAFKKNKPISLEESIRIVTFDNVVNRDKSISKYIYSYFSNYELAKNGDYTIIDKGNSSGVFQIIDKENNIFNKIDIKQGAHSLSNHYIKIDNTSDLNKFITTRDISSEYAVDIADVNNWNIETEKPSGDYSEISYFIPKGTDISDMTLLRSNNLNKGFSVERDSRGKLKIDISDNYVDVTEQLKERIEKALNKKIDGLFVRKSGTFIWRNANRFFRFREFSQLSIDKKKFLLQTNAYVTLSTKVGLENKIYRIANLSESSVTLEYNTFSNSGKLLTILKDIPKEEFFDRVGIYYIMHGNSKIPFIKREQIQIQKNNQIDPDISERKDIYTKVSSLFSGIFKIDVDISSDYTEMSDKKAWVESEPGKEPKIVLNLNNNKASDTDLVHEYLHLFLFALKYNNSFLYENLLLDYKNKNNIEYSDWNLIEESLVAKLSDFMNNKSGVPLVNFKYFSQAFSESLKLMKLKDVSIENNIFGILNKPMKEIFPEINSKVMNEGVILFESNFRNWFSDKIKNDKNFKIECI